MKPIQEKLNFDISVFFSLIIINVVIIVGSFILYGRYKEKKGIEKGKVIGYDNCIQDNFYTIYPQENGK